MGRAPCCDKTKVKRGPWSPEEDHTLKNYVETYGTGGNWISLPHKAGLKRCGKSCRLRWLNYLRPNIKHGGFTEEEDNVILSLYHTIGSRWSMIASQLSGRTDNEVKNYWNTKLKKKLLAAPPGPSYPTATSTSAATGNYMSPSNYNTNHHNSMNFSSVSSVDKNTNNNNMVLPCFRNDANFNNGETITGEMLMEAMMPENAENYLYNSGTLFPLQEGLSPSFSTDNNNYSNGSGSLSGGEEYEAAFLGGLMPNYEYTNVFDFWSSMLSFEQQQNHCQM